MNNGLENSTITKVSEIQMITWPTQSDSYGKLISRNGHTEIVPCVWTLVWLSGRIQNQKANLWPPIDVLTSDNSSDAWFNWWSWWIVAFWCRKFDSIILSELTLSCSSSQAQTTLDIIVSAWDNFLVSFGPSASSGRSCLTDTIWLDLTADWNTTISDTFFNWWITGTFWPLLPCLPLGAFDWVFHTSKWKSVVGNHIVVRTTGNINVRSAEIIFTVLLINFLIYNWPKANSSSAMIFANFNTWLPFGPITPTESGGRGLSGQYWTRQLVQD